MTLLKNLFPDSIHVKTIALDTAEDTELWDYACDNNYLILSKDVDFISMSKIRGYPPKVIWIGLGNCATKTVVDYLRARYADIHAFAESPDQGLFVLL